MQLNFRRLRLWNLVIGLFQLITGAAILGITDYGWESRLPWYTFFIASWSRDNDSPPGSFYK